MTKGFTLIEAATGIAIILLLSLLSGPALRLFQEKSLLGNTAEETMAILRSAQSKAKASEGNSPWGVYVDASANPNTYTLFKGATYAARDVSQDKVAELSSKAEFSDISLGGGNETVFQKVTGFPVPPGSISFWLSSDHSQARTISLNSFGAFTIGTFPVLSDESRVKDSRHVHIAYTGRVIDPLTESVRLVFPEMTQTIPMAAFLSGGAFSWAGDVEVAGETQKIRIHTHLLNDPALGTQFSVHRDRRYNTKSLIVELSGDSTGNLLQYDAAGQTTKGTSLYVSNPFWQ